MEFLTSLGVAVLDTLLDASAYLLFGFFFAGLLKALVSEKTIVRHIGTSSVGSVLKASLIGTPMPLCSCSVIPVATSLRQNGASKGATVSFLISTPESGVDSIAISYALLDPIMTVFRPLAAFVSAVTAGVIENFQSSRDVRLDAPAAPVCDDCHCRDGAEGPLPFAIRLRRGLRYAFTDLFNDIAYYLLIGLLISAVISALLPDDFFAAFLSNDILAMSVMLVIGIPLYVCASASTPVAAAFIMKGISPGAALVFLLVGPATNAATIGVVKKNLGTRSLLTYLLSIATVAVILGILLNALYGFLGLEDNVQLGTAGEFLPEWLRWASAAIFTPMLLYGSYRELRKRAR